MTKYIVYWKTDTYPDEGYMMSRYEWTNDVTEARHFLFKTVARLYGWLLISDHIMVLTLEEAIIQHIIDG